MDLAEFKQYVSDGNPIKAGSKEHYYMVECSNNAMKVTSKLNACYHTPEEVQQILSELTASPINETVRLFPPFYADFGKNITLGKNVFINSLCYFMDQGGITIEDNVHIGPHCSLVTMNHGLYPKDRATTYPSAILIKKNAWLGAGVIICPGVTIGENTIVAAGAVVTKDVPDNVVVAGVPARQVKSIDA